MSDLTRSTQTVTTFRRNTAGMLKQLNKSKRALTLTVNGKPTAIVQDAEAYQRLLDIAARADTLEAIDQGLADVASGDTIPAEAVFEELRSLYNIHR